MFTLVGGPYDGHNCVADITESTTILRCEIGATSVGRMLGETFLHGSYLIIAEYEIFSKLESSGLAKFVTEYCPLTEEMTLTPLDLDPQIKNQLLEDIKKEDDYE